MNPSNPNNNSRSSEIDLKTIPSIIKTYKNACGTIHSHKLIGELRQKYMRRPAFLEELGKIR
ncbi:hypothetical protein ACSU6B_08030 [Neobacillus sp. C211]|uniref:hypothetical protein n=1 Tax=unclassified Neobacillus TaxID=2675272 RepID=UPI00397A5BE7